MTLSQQWAGRNLAEPGAHGWLSGPSLALAQRGSASRSASKRARWHAHARMHACTHAQMHRCTRAHTQAGMQAPTVKMCTHRSPKQPEFEGWQVPRGARNT
eukprot:13109013-Alexandrium_andersonii.AAC.1